MCVRFEYLTSTELSDIGRKRSRNEDAVMRVPEYGVFSLADGMGGGDAGDEASKRTVDGIADGLRERLAGKTAATADAKCRVIRRQVNQASQWICQRARERGRGMSGSTIVAFVFDPVTPSTASVLHAGDSRLYRFRNNALTQITNDHSFAAEAGYKSGDQIPPQFRGVVTRAVGIKESVELEHTSVDVAEDDVFLMCSDGLSGMVPDRKIRKFCRRHAGKPLEDLAQNLVNAANEAGGKDNISVVLVRAGELLPIPAAEAFDLAEEESEVRSDTEDALPMEAAPEGEEGIPTTEDDLVPATAPAAAIVTEAAEETATVGSATPVQTEGAVAPVPATTDTDVSQAPMQGEAVVSPEPAEEAGLPPDAPRPRGPANVAIVLVLLAASAFAVWKVLPRRGAPSGAQEWITTMQADMQEGETYLAYAGRLKDYVVQLDQFAEQDPASAGVGEASAVVRASARAVPQQFQEELGRRIARGSRESAARMIEDWRQMKQYCGLLGLDDARYAAASAAMQKQMSDMDSLDAVREVSSKVRFETAYLQQLAEHLEELNVPTAEKTEGVRQAVKSIRQATFEWTGQFDRTFERTAQERNAAGLEAVVLKWESLGGIPCLLELVKERYDEQRGEIDQRLRAWGTSLADDVNAALNHGAADAADAALRELRALAHALRKTSFAACVSETFSACARAVEDARAARTSAANEASRVRGMITELKGLDGDALSETVAAFEKLKGLQEVDPAVVDELRAKAQTMLVAVCKSASGRAAEAFTALEVEAGDRLVEELTRFTDGVPKELGRERLDPFLDEAERARREAEQQVGDLAEKLADAAATLADSAARDRWPGAVRSLHGLAPRRNLNVEVKGAWEKAVGTLGEQLSRLLTETDDYGQWLANAGLAAVLLRMPEMESVLTAPVTEGLCRRVEAMRSVQEAVAELDHLGWRIKDADVADISDVLQALASAHEKWSPELRDSLAPRADALVAGCAARTGELVAREADIGKLRALVNQEEFLRFVPKDKCRELVAAINARDQRISFQAALQTGAWGAFWRNAGATPADTRSLSELGMLSAAHEWHGLWSDALTDEAARQRKQRLAKHRTASRQVCDGAGLEVYSRGAPDWTCTREEWADYYCRYVHEDGQHVVAGLERKLEGVMTVVESLDSAPANAPDDMWRIVGLSRTRDAAGLQSRLGEIREGIDLVRQWMGKLGQSPLVHGRVARCPALDMPLLKMISVE